MNRSRTSARSISGGVQPAVVNLQKNMRFQLPAVFALAASAATASKPNIVIVLTDDQGYGDLQSHGHPFLKAPHLDALAGESIRLKDFHAGTTCSPSRASLLTGRWSNRVGVWHTIRSRSILRTEEITIAEILADAGCRTGLFGKWHLGGNYPYRPEDQGFQEVYGFQGGALSFSSDLWDNAYFDDRYLHNGVVVTAEGFCTDVFFDQSMRFIKESVDKDQPFFALIATGAPHAPMHAPEAYLELYEGQRNRVLKGLLTSMSDTRRRLRRSPCIHATGLRTMVRPSRSHRAKSARRNPPAPAPIPLGQSVSLSRGTIASAPTAGRLKSITPSMRRSLRNPTCRAPNGPPVTLRSSPSMPARQSFPSTAGKKAAYRLMIY